MDTNVVQDKFYVVFSTDGAQAFCTSRAKVAEAVLLITGKEVRIHEVSSMNEADEYIEFFTKDAELRQLEPASHRNNIKKPVASLTPLFIRANELIDTANLEYGETIALKGGNKNE